MKSIQELTDATTPGTTIDSNLSFTGTMVLNGTGSVRIAGAFEGNIIALGGSVIIQEGGVMRGSIKAANVIVSGNVSPTSDTDQIEASQCLALTSTARVSSPAIHYGSIAMEFGATIVGGMTPLEKKSGATIMQEKVTIIDSPRYLSSSKPQNVIEAMSRDELMAPIRTAAAEDREDTLTSLAG